MAFSNGTDRDEQLARTLQEQFRREVEELASPSAWSQIQGVFSSSPAVASGAPSSSRAAAAASSDEVVVPRADRTPRRKRPTGVLAPGTADTADTADTVDTAASSTPSPDQRAVSRPPAPAASSGGLSHIEWQLQRQRQRAEREGARGSPRAFHGASPRSSPRESFGLLGALFDSGDAAVASGNEAVARRLEMELRDAELASALAAADAAAPSRPGGFAVDASPPRRRGGRLSRGLDADAPPADCGGKAAYYALRAFLGALVAGIIFIVWTVVFGPATGEEALDPSTWMPGYPESDPSLGSVGEHNIWRLAEGKMTGLRLTVINNIQRGSDWNEHLESSLYEWDNGDPDAVTLNVRKLANDPDCRAVRRAMKVCNANYGPTDWRGVNQILLQDEYIITSLAKMNDYYLEGTNKAQKQYTMCHELGHGLGLGHSDENFHNKDLGNCMDYTERPQNNMHPDKSNFVTLEKLYGNVDGNVDSHSVKTERLRVHDDGDRRRATTEKTAWPEESEDEFELFAAHLMDPIVLSSEDDAPRHRGWRVLRRTEMAEFHEVQLGNGYSIRTSILLA